MSTVVAFAPMNLRLYDKDERDLRTFVSPIFNSATNAEDDRGLCAHIVADNGGGKSSLLLFFELLFCKPGGNYPSVGKKKVIDYLRRAELDLHDSSPTTMAALVRRDDASVMRSARDTIFGYTVKLRDSKGTSTEIRRFVIHLAENPAYTLEKLAKEVVYDSNGVPRALRDVCDRLRSVPGCTLYDGSEWDEYAREMIEAGISPILWRELAKMNVDEEAAGTYFQSSDAFRNIVRLVSEAQAPISGEQAKPLWDVASNIASQVATQAEDRAREKECKTAGDAVHVLSEAVGHYANAREALKNAEDQAHWGERELEELKREMVARIDELQEKGEGFKRQWAENEQLHVSSKIRANQVELQAQRQTAEMLREDMEQKQRAYWDAKRRMALDDAAHSYQRYKQLDARYRAKRDELEVLKGNMKASEELANASRRAWTDLHGAEQGVRRALDDAQQKLDAATRDVLNAKDANRNATALLERRSVELGSAQGTLDSALDRLEQLASKAEGMQAVQKTINGFYASQAVETLANEALRETRSAENALKQARELQERCEEDHEVARVSLEEARLEATKKLADASVWANNLARVNELDTQARKALSLWEEPVELIAIGKMDEARKQVDAHHCEVVQEERNAREQSALLQRRLDALASGRLDMSDQLRRWLDKHSITTRTLASYEGISTTVRSTLFEATPWLAHVLVADDRASAALLRLTESNELSELGHPVFYVRQSDVHELMESGAQNTTEKVQGLVHALHTIEKDYLDDPDAYERRIKGELEALTSRIEDLQQVAQSLDTARDAIVALASFLKSIGMGEGASVAGVMMREESARTASEKAGESVHQCEETHRALEKKLGQLKDRVASASAKVRHARNTQEALVSVREQNDVCIQAASTLDNAKLAHQKAAANKKSTSAEYERASFAENQAQAELDGVRREQNSVCDLRRTLEELSTETDDEAGPEAVGKTERTCTSSELKGSIAILKDILSRQNSSLEIAQRELDSTRDQRNGENIWKRKLREIQSGGTVITKDDIETWVPRDEVDRDRLVKEESRAQNESDAARRAHQAADNEATLSEERLKRLFSQLEQTGLREPLEIPDGYDYQATKAAIEADDEQNSMDLRRVQDDKERLGALSQRLDHISFRLSRVDEYRAKAPVSPSELTNLDAWDAFVSELERVEKACAVKMRETRSSLEDSQSEALEAVRKTGEISAARNTKESVDAVMHTCSSYEGMMQVKNGLENQSMQFKTMAATLHNKLRATDESIDDLVKRAVKEGYQLLDELHHLVTMSRVNITGKSRQRTIDFRSRGKTQFVSEIRRDEVVTSRLERHVRRLLMEELPSIEDAVRAERAKVWFEPHELVYVLLDDRSVEVRYPVIRGGKGLSYESARDVMGSGSTGQKSAGYVLAFLALLRYLGSVGSLSSENSLFVALENQFGKISSSKIILDIKKVVDQMHMQLITVAGRELRSAYAIGDVTFTLRRLSSANGAAAAMRIQIDESDQKSADAIIDSFRATRQFENLRFDLMI